MEWETGILLDENDEEPYAATAEKGLPMIFQLWCLAREWLRLDSIWGGCYTELYWLVYTCTAGIF